MKDVHASKPRGRPRGFDTDAVLDRAVEVFWERGYEGASLDDLTAAMGLNRPSVYAAFGDKRGLFLAALDRYAGTLGRRPLEALMAASDPREGLQAFLAEVVDLATGGATAKGCFLACVASNAASCEPLVRDRLSAIIEATDGAITIYLEQARSEGRLGRGMASDFAARLVVSVMQGLAIRARAGVPRERLAAMASEAAAELADSLDLGT